MYHLQLLAMLVYHSTLQKQPYVLLLQVCSYANELQYYYNYIVSKLPSQVNAQNINFEYVQDWRQGYIGYAVIIVNWKKPKGIYN